jgi:hypothetical protein
VPIATISANQILFSTFGLMLATALFSLYGVNGQDWRKKAGPWVLAMALIALVHGLIIITRLIMHPMRTALLWCSSYYCHFFVIYVLLICVVIASSQLASASVWRKFCTDYLSLALLAVALNSASITRQLCVSCAEKCRPVIEGSVQIDAFIKKQLAEGAPPRICCTTADKNELGLCHLGSILDLYPRYHVLTKDQATHLVSYRDDGIIVIRRNSE